MVFPPLLYQQLLLLQNLGLQQFILSINLTVNFQTTQLFSLEDVGKKMENAQIITFTVMQHRKRQRSLHRLMLSTFQSTNY